MQNMHKSTHDRPLTGVHWPIHRAWCRGSRTKGDLSTSTSSTYRGAGWRTEAVYITTLYPVYDTIDHLSFLGSTVYKGVQKSLVGSTCVVYIRVYR